MKERVAELLAKTTKLKEKEIKLIARYINDAISNHKNNKTLKQVNKEVKKLCKKFPIYKNLK